MFPLELLDNLIDQTLVEVLTTQLKIAIGRDRAKLPFNRLPGSKCRRLKLLRG